jgi:hypothetical protein
MFDDRRQRTVAHLIIAGVVVLALSCVLLFLGSFGGVMAIARRGDLSWFLLTGVSVLGGFLGIGLIVGGLAQGWRGAFVNASKAPVQSANDVYVVAKMVMDKHHENVFDEDMHDPKDLRYLVQLQFPNGRRMEFRTAPEVFHSFGEGMRGTAQYQGDWLSRFQPVLRPADAEPHDPAPWR